MTVDHTEHVAGIIEMVARSMRDSEDYNIHGPALAFMTYMWRDAIKYALEQLEASID